MPHIPVLLQRVMEFLNPQPGDFVVDATIDGGGHSRAIIKKISPGGTLLGVDWDGELLKKLKDSFHAENSKLLLVNGNYANLPEILAAHRLPKADGLLLDLGFSSEQLEHSNRGFSFLKDEPLLMTYDPQRESVREILQKVHEEELAKIIFEFGEDRFGKRIARAIKERESAKPIETTQELRDVILGAVPKRYERGGIHPATRTFQALRIYANSELQNLESILKSIRSTVQSGGRVLIITFHSLEDRLVKNYFRNMEKRNEATLLTKKPISATFLEVKENPRSRSAKLRAIQVV